MHFLVIDARYGVPIYVFLESDPNDAARQSKLRGRWVSLEPASTADCDDLSQLISDTSAAVGGDPNRPDRYVVFASEGAVRAAGYFLVEPRYMGPNWETYLSVFHPEGGKKSSPTTSRPRAGRPH